MTFKVEKGIEIPKAKTRNKYPVGTMEVGDSFFTPLENKSSQRVQTALIQYTKSNRFVGMTFTTRVVEENGIRGVRLWRVS